ncbi:MAG: UDP-glucose 4-epimerase, partial [Desulfovibrionaceae bacterium]|nr:UDP-glucose 4-epimerase [Desulfovibrionaceae bacterium]
PINPYGRTKLIMEWMLGDFATAYDLPWAALRYFNAAGADPDGETGELHDPETHLIPNVLKAIRDPKMPLNLFGNDYDTPDGTCIRDYIHVVDLAAAHVLALKYLLGSNPSISINLGTGHGASVLEIIKTAEDVTGKKVPYKIQQRRAGDPSKLVADSNRARKILGWDPKFDNIRTIIETPWNWMEKQK